MFVEDENITSTTLAGIENNLDKGVYTFFNLLKALLENRFDNNIKICVWGKGLSVLDSDIVIPENASLAALTKVITVEYPNFQCRYLDVDKNTDIEKGLVEVFSDSYQYNYAFRDNEIYINCMKEVLLKKNNNIDIRVNDGTYLITGGTGGLGIEVANYIGHKAETANIVLVNRSWFPDKSQWENIKEENKDTKRIKVIRTIEKLESEGKTVNILQGDIAQESDVKSIIEYVVSEYGSVNGVFHLAGVAGEGILLKKNFETFKKVAAPKIKGSYLLDLYTKDYNPDFMIMFSSILTELGDIGQSDYMAGNAFMDAFAIYRNKEGRFTRTINWPAWKETGMAVDYNVADAENAIDSMLTEDAFIALEAIIQSEYDRILPGKLNYQLLSKRMDRYRFKFDERLQILIDSKVELMNVLKGDGVERIKVEKKEQYSNTENILYAIWVEVLGISDFDITDTFSGLGGDSYLAIQLFKAINQEFDDVIEMADVFTYPTIQEMAMYINGIRNTKAKLVEEHKDENISTSIEDAISVIEGILS